MKARIPAGIDLEDRLLYGLSPARLGYVVTLLVVAAWFWRQPLWGPLRWLPGLLFVGLAAAAGWLQHDGRHLDAWVQDIARHLLSRYRLHVHLDEALASRLPASLRTRLLRSPP